jgi:hypothetical protein
MQAARSRDAAVKDQRLMEQKWQKKVSDQRAEIRGLQAHVEKVKGLKSSTGTGYRKPAAGGARAPSKELPSLTKRHAFGVVDIKGLQGAAAGQDRQRGTSWRGQPSQRA